MFIFEVMVSIGDGVLVDMFLTLRIVKDTFYSLDLGLDLGFVVHVLGLVLRGNYSPKPWPCACTSSKHIRALQTEAGRQYNLCLFAGSFLCGIALKVVV